MSIINTIIKYTEQALPLALGLAQSQNTPKATIDFNGAASQMLVQINALIKAIKTGQLQGQDKVSAIGQTEQAIYQFQRLPQNKAWKSKDNAAFKQIEATLIAKLNELRTASPVITTNGEINDTGINPILGNTGDNFINGIDNKYLFWGIGGIFAYFVLIRK